MSDTEVEAIPAEVEWIGRRVIGCAVSVHRDLGPGHQANAWTCWWAGFSSWNAKLWKRLLQFTAGR